MNQTDLKPLPGEHGHNGHSGVGDSSPTQCSTKSAMIHQFLPSRELTVYRDPPPREYRDVVCDLCEKIVSLSLEVPLSALQAKTRQSPDVALARQIAMYLCNTMFSVQFSDIGIHFDRDRTTVSYACGLVEDKRDELAFDVMLCQLESLLTDAFDLAIAINFRTIGRPE